MACATSRDRVLVSEDLPFEFTMKSQLLFPYKFVITTNLEATLSPCENYGINIYYNDKFPDSTSAGDAFINEDSGNWEWYNDNNTMLLVYI